MLESWKVSSLYIKYEVSNFGKIRNRKTKRLKKFQLGAGGYLYTTLQLSSGKQRPCLVHIVIATEWVTGQSAINNTVHHKDDDKTNFYPSNLEWIPHSDNDKHTYDNNLRKRKITFATAEEIRHLYKDGYSNSSLANLFNVSRSTISDIIANRTHIEGLTYNR